MSDTPSTANGQRSLATSAGDDEARTRSIPWWVWGLILGLGAITPLCHYWVAHYPPPSGAFTGLRTVDDGQFRQSMRAFLPGFRSPYVLNISPYAPGFIPPSGLAWILGSLGVLGNWLHIDEFLMLGLGNGVSAGLYLIAVYLLLREVAPRQANLGFCLHTLGGGLAGVTFLVSSLTGWAAAPDFERWFYRVAQCELNEGVTLNPVTLFPRMYYSLALACLFYSMLLLHRYLRLGHARRLIFAGVLAGLGAFINVRYGIPLGLVVVLWLISATGQSARRRVAVGVTMGAGVTVGSLASVVTIALNPAVMGNQFGIRDSVWLSSLVIAGLWHVLAAPVPCVQAIRRLPTAPRVIAYAFAGWVAAYVTLFLGYNLYYGSVLAPADFTTTLWATDKAIVGAVFGACLALFDRRRAAAGMDRPDWLALVFLVFIVMSIGIFFGGWYLRITPQRQLIIASVPLCVLSAMGIQQLKVRAPWAAWALTAAFILCGICSQAVSLCYYLGPLNWRPGHEPYSILQYTTMSNADAVCLKSLGEGTVLSTPKFGDIIGVRNAGSTVFGNSSMALGGVPWKRVRDDWGLFFSEGVSDSVRREIVERYAVKYIYCPDTTPTPKRVVSALQHTPWLETVTQLGDACVLRVIGAPDAH